MLRLKGWEKFHEVIHEGNGKTKSMDKKSALQDSTAHSGSIQYEKDALNSFTYIHIHERSGAMRAVSNE